jgi:hypothetical protein
MEVEDYNHTVRPRRDLLRSYGSAAMVIGERTYKKIEDQDGTIGWLARKLAFIAFPIFWWIRFQWLSQLSFIDRRIQTVEWIASKIFPRSRNIFSKIDGGFVGELPGLSVFSWVAEVIEEIFKNMMSLIPDFGSSCAEKAAPGEESCG